MRKLPPSSLGIVLPNHCEVGESYLSPTKDGHLCGKCQKVVVDFSKMSDDEVRHYIQSNGKPECGFFRSDQLRLSNRDQKESPPKSSFSWQWLFVLLIMLAAARINSFTYNLPPELKVETVQTAPSNPTRTRRIFIKGEVYKDNRKFKPARHAVVSLPSIGQSVTCDRHGHFTMEVEVPDSLESLEVHLFHDRWGLKEMEINNLEADTIDWKFYFAMTYRRGKW